MTFALSAGETNTGHERCMGIHASPQIGVWFELQLNKENYGFLLI
jgi:hypothetical protein